MNEDTRVVKERHHRAKKLSPRYITIPFRLGEACVANFQALIWCVWCAISPMFSIDFGKKARNPQTINEQTRSGKIRTTDHPKECLKDETI